MQLKFLIDECLPPRLASLAIQRGHPLSTCVRNRGWSGKLDHELKDFALAEDLTLVTHNARDFRGVGAAAPGGLYARIDLHAGLVCLIAGEMDLATQLELFEAALDAIAMGEDPINSAWKSS